MAKLIKDTPILYGKESDKFLKMVAENESKKVAHEEHKKTKEAFKKIMANAKF